MELTVALQSIPVNGINLGYSSASAPSVITYCACWNWLIKPPLPVLSIGKLLGWAHRFWSGAIGSITHAIATVDGEPRILDIDLARSLGFAQPVEIRKLIARHAKSLNDFSILVTVAKIHPGPGRPAIEYWLNKQQALFIVAESDDQGGTASASIGAARATTPNETETRLVGAVGGLERAFWKGSAPSGCSSACAPSVITCCACWNRLI